MQPWQEDASSRVNMFSFPDDHVSCWSQQAYGRSEGEWIQQPKLNWEVVGAALRQRCYHQYIVVSHMTCQDLSICTSPDSPSYWTGRLPINFMRSFWVLSEYAEIDNRSSQFPAKDRHLQKCTPGVFSKSNPLYVPVEAVIPGKIRWIFCSSSTATSRNLYWYQGGRETN